MLFFFVFQKELIGPGMLKNITLNQMRLKLSFPPYFALLRHSVDIILNITTVNANQMKL